MYNFNVLLVITDGISSFFFSNTSESDEKQQPVVVDHTCFPCIRREWYTKPPKNPDDLMDNFCHIDTNTVALDLRNFLKKKSISLENFSRSYLKRRQVCRIANICRNREL